MVKQVVSCPPWVLAEEVKIPRGLQEGSPVVFADAGAYDASMAYSFGKGRHHDD